MRRSRTVATCLSGDASRLVYPLGSMRSSRVVAPLLILVLVVGWAVPAVAQESPPAEAGSTAEVAPMEPAVVVQPPAKTETTQPWTYRYLVPLLIVLALVTVFGTVVQYFVRVVRGRYKLVR